MTATEITISKARNKTGEDWMIAEQNLKRAIVSKPTPNTKAQP
jgi:hypothetical protein